MGLSFFPEPKEDEKNIRYQSSKIARDHIRPYVLQDDESSYYRKEAFKALGQANLVNILLPKEHGGQSLSYRCYYGAIEEISRASLSMSVVVGVTHLVQGALLAFGNRDQKSQFLPKLGSGQFLGAFSLSEPLAGSDAANLRLSAKEVSGGYLLNGNKLWCSNAGHADIYLVMARTGEHPSKGISAFLVSSSTKGFRIGKEEKKLGLRGSSLCELIFDQCFIPDSCLVGERGMGLSVALSQLDSGRASIGAASLGLSIEVLDILLNTHSRSPLPQGTLLFFSDYYAEIQALKCLLQEIANQKDQNRRVTLLASQMKLMSSDLAMKISSDAVHFVGPAGVTAELGLERLMRDAKALQIVEGTNQIQRTIIARELEKNEL